MPNDTLLDELQAACLQHGRATMLAPDAAHALLEKAAAAFVADPSCLHWWDALKVPAERYCYAGSDGLTLLQTMLADFGDVYLVVTDDMPFPWTVIIISSDDVAAVLQECRYFEYFLLASDLRSIVFDTHHNELVSATAMP